MGWSGGKGRGCWRRTEAEDSHHEAREALSVTGFLPTGIDSVAENFWYWRHDRT